MKNSIFETVTNRKIAKNTYETVLRGDCDGMRPGQFVNIKLNGLYLRRPVSVCNIENDLLTIVYKAVGVGTDMLASALPGEKLDLLTGLGNGYDLTKAGKRPLLIGGGAGVPPLYYLCRRLKEQGASPVVVLGFGCHDEVFYVDKFRDAGAEIRVTTVDGSYGIKGFVTDAFPTEYGYVYTCGPEPMLKAVYAKSETSGQFSFEERMGCGFGACMGCTCKTKYGNKRICRDGPVLEKEEIIW